MVRTKLIASLLFASAGMAALAAAGAASAKDAAPDPTAAQSENR